MLTFSTKDGGGSAKNDGGRERVDESKKATKRNNPKRGNDA